MSIAFPRRRRRQVRRISRGDRSGFTLIELMVAVMVFTVGVLATVGSAAMVMTMISGSQRRTVATTVAEARFERLRAESCAAHTNGSATTRGVRESWQITPLVQADDVTVYVTFPSSGGRVASQTYRTYIPC